MLVREPAVLEPGLRLAGARMRHRGPDDHGYLEGTCREFCCGREASGRPATVGLVHQRLSILDLSERGRQPMVSADGRSAICFNGEIYNYRELRRELEAQGAEFHTGTDTEVLLSLLQRRGKGAVGSLRGMFAFAWLDLDRGTLVLARDFFGIKPLYLSEANGELAFASEVSALEALHPANTALNPQAVYSFLRFGIADDGRATLHQGIRQLPPGHLLEVPLENPAAGREETCWKLRLEETSRLSFADAAAELKDRFLQSIRLHLRSDVPVGAALSGGIDSSAIVACMRMAEPSAEIHAFTYAPQGFSLNEEPWARMAAAAAGAQLHPVDFTAEELAADLDRLLSHQEEPFGSTSIYAQYRIFRAAKEAGVTVMLDGQGGDETLAGYSIYFAARLAGMVRRGEWKDLWSLWRNRDAVGGGHRSAWFQAAGHLLPAPLANAGRRLVGKELYPAWLRREYFDRAGVRGGRLEAPLDESGVRGVLADTLTRTVLPQLLHFEDRNSMAWSVESRVPFLHLEVVEFALSLPESFLLGNDGVTKKVFREAMRGLVPDAILDRRDKIGFHTPGNLLLAEARPWVESILARIPEAAAEIINPAGLRRLWQTVAAGKIGNDHGFWRALCFLRWLQLRETPLMS